jgi:hypothetical protein
MIERCINLDWLEVCAMEPLAEPRDANYFRSCGSVVIEREYGSKVWRDIFTIEDEHGHAFIEVRRAPKSEIIAQNITHLRLVNRYCYFEDAPDIMQAFLDTHGYEFHHITRVDICLDFEYFDYGDKPRDFMRRYIEGKFSKINQANVHAHGSDEWSGRVWNSVSWGAPSSDVGTKFYNKTLELYDPITKRYGKPYIREAWQAAHLVDDMTDCTKVGKDGERYTVEVWRVEFSIRSSVRKWFCIELNGKQRNKQSIRNTLDMYNSKAKLLILFASLSEHYFHFKHLIKRYKFYEEGHTDGYALRKDRCPDKLLFRWKDTQQFYKIEKEHVSGNNKPDSHNLRLLGMLKEFRDRTFDKALKQSASVIIDYLQDHIARQDIANNLTRQDIVALRMALSRHMKHPTIDPALLIKMAKEELSIRDEIDPFY